MVRRTWRSTPVRVTVTFDDLEYLQRATDRLVHQGFGLAPQDRARLHRLASARGIRFGEGDLVQIRGFIVGTPFRRRADSANCNLPSAAENSFRFHLAADAYDTTFDSMIAEMIPQHRARAWTLRKLRQLQRDHRLLLVRGQLFYDSTHFVNDDPDADLPGQPPRITLWELHPVAQLLVSRSVKNDCNEQDSQAWAPLASFE